MELFKDCKLSESSKQLYKTRIQKWMTFMPLSLRDIDFIVCAPKRALHYLSLALEEFSSNTTTNIHCYISSIVALFTHSSGTISHLPGVKGLGEEWVRLQKENTAKITERRLQNKPTEAQEEKLSSDVKFDDLIKARDTLELGSTEHLLFSFYTYIYPLRADLYAVEIVEPGQAPTCENYIIHSSKCSSLVIGNYKTVKKYGKIIYDKLPDPLHDALLVSLRIHPREYLFIDANGNVFNRDSFSKWTGRIFTRVMKTSMSISVIRHLFVSTLDFNMKAEDLKAIGDKMGHSLSMQKLYQWTD
jgi:hypothetical protein